MIKLAVSGCLGRMGQAISRLATKDNTFMIAALLEREGHPESDQILHGVPVSSNHSALNGCHVLIEFTSPEATMKNLENCRKYNVKMVIGTTGLNEEQENEIKKASKTIPIVYASNMSVGVNLLFKLIQVASEITGKNYTINMTEAHHIHKKDAPSGTAKTMAKLAEQYSHRKVSNIDSIREGEIIGDHEIIFESHVDVLKISHHAKTRDIFAEGSLVAAKFVANRESGLYSMQDVLGLNK